MIVHDTTLTTKEVLRSRATLVGGLLLAVFSLGLMWILLPRIGVRDSDAHAYIVGAYSLQSGNGYVTLDGTKINQWWPPGYSLLLSLFSQPLVASMVINYLAFGGAITLLYLIAVFRDWDRRIAISAALAIGFGFFRQIGSSAKPDILVYSVFLLALYIYLGGGRTRSTISFLLWSLLIPFKLVAVVFTPAAMVADLLTAGKELRHSRRYWTQFVAVGFVWLASIGGLFLYNYSTLGSVMAAHGRNDFNRFTGEVVQFIVSVPRLLLANWYGSILVPWVSVLFFLLLAVGLACLASLRRVPHARFFLIFGTLIFVLIWSLQIVSTFDADVRIMGYSLIVLLFAFRPTSTAWKRWGIYALMTVCMAVLNLSLVNTYGINDPRYQTMSYDLLEEGLPEGKIYTNSFHLLDVHVRVLTHPIEDLSQLENGVTLLWVELPRYDAIASVVWPMERPGPDWCEIREVEGAILFQKCQP